MKLWRKKDVDSPMTNAANEAESKTSAGRKWTWIILGILGCLIAVCIIIMIANYRFPSFFSVQPDQGAVGLTSTKTMISLVEKMNRRWLPNDKFYPTIFLDNPQNFQLGLLESLRYVTRVFRDKVTRLRTTDKIDSDMENAFVFFSNDPFKWILPSAESKFKAGERSLRDYEARLLAGEAKFYPRADNLNEIIGQFVSLLGGVNTRLSNAPRRKNKTISEETAGDEFTKGEQRVHTRVPRTKIDDNFYFARGVAYGIRHMMIAMKYDFDNIFKVKNAEELLDRVIEVLDESQFEPLVVLNGSRGSIFANHSLQLMSLLEDARQKMRSLQDMIRE
ncbi:MAG: DUF2333 family protein [Deltaproteobacteria bacterium]|nr:DUF2333 family protein [Deltaproteobacteria bacterium]MBW2142086.1 DUF2333 family protein [Deltaproteobacteria bacterium]MBW2324595.1 DUF2333 family protein [Deltaproteobacteria bacterium]